MKITQQSHHFSTVFAVQVAGRLICQQKGRAGNQGPANADPLLLTAGKLMGQMVHPILDAQNLGQLFQLVFVDIASIQQQR